MDIRKDFEKPEKHPYGMLEGYINGYEKESVLAFIFKNSWLHDFMYQPCEMKYNHSSMVEDGLLDEVAPLTYRLTTKSVGLLFTIYGRKET
jgi:hypothetical protein